MPFGMEKVEWCGYRSLKFFDDIFIRFDMNYERDRHTQRHRHRMTT